MIIASKKFPDKIHEVTVEQWRAMQRNDIARRYRVLSTADLAPMTDEPVKAIDYMTKPEVKKIYDDEHNDREDEYVAMLKDDLITECKKRDIELTGSEYKRELIKKLLDTDNRW